MEHYHGKSQYYPAHQRENYYSRGSEPAPAQHAAGYGPFYRNGYVRYSIPSWIHVVLGILIFILGLFDLGWTVAKYGHDCSDSSDVDDYEECEGTHAYTYVAAPVWGAIFMVLCGVCGIWMSPVKLTYSVWVYYCFLGLSFFTALIMCPVIIVLQILELHFGEGHFYVDKEGEALDPSDNVKFAMPTILIILAGMELLVALTTLSTACCCPPASMGNEGFWNFRFRRQPTAYNDYGNPPPVYTVEDYDYNRDYDDYSDYTDEDYYRRKLGNETPRYLPRVPRDVARVHRPRSYNSRPRPQVNYNLPRPHRRY